LKSIRWRMDPSRRWSRWRRSCRKASSCEFRERLDWKPWSGCWEPRRTKTGSVGEEP
jgi:hypothetical protein